MCIISLLNLFKFIIFSDDLFDSQPLHFLTRVSPPSSMTQPFFTMPNPAAHKLEALRQLFPQAVEVDDRGNIRVNAAVMQMALDPGNPAGVRVEEDGYELRWVGRHRRRGRRRHEVTVLAGSHGRQR